MRTARPADAGPPQAPGWHVYLVRCADGSLYTGIAVDVERRLEEHRAGAARGAKYLRGRGPLELMLERPIGTLAEALRVEWRIKRLSKQDKESLLANPPGLDALVAAARRPASA